MPRKQKARWGWEPSHDSEGIAQREGNLDYDWLAEQIGSDGSVHDLTFEQEIVTMLWQFYDTQFGDPGPTEKEIQAALYEIVEAAELLSKKFKNLDWHSRIRLGFEFNDWAETDEHGFPDEALYHSAELFLRSSSNSDGPKIIESVDVLSKCVSNMAFAEEKTSRGPKPKTPVKNLVFHVSELIRRRSGTNPLDGFYHNAIEDRFEGLLVRVLEHIFDGFAPELNMTNSAIGGQIRRTIGDRSES